ncbi:hypothetical protein [Clostridium manihotivorum]|uniref:DUF5673 domain-containing protein n=1 Tax=Clostridium manihotivorum TaxID=2320868 RepID=A0A3R5QXP6_9CLOT|nr:hypothetical protein [Clostridium manihotivorum]QAA35107.1 hypothetical protein C1I91_27620 [Clostridium manihotivorum]
MTSIIILIVLLFYVYILIREIRVFNNRVLNRALIREYWFEYRSDRVGDIVWGIIAGFLVFIKFALRVLKSKTSYQDTSTTFGLFESFFVPQSFYSFQFVVASIMMISFLFMEVKAKLRTNVIGKEGILAEDGAFVEWHNIIDIKESDSSKSALDKIIEVETYGIKKKIIKLVVPSTQLKSTIETMRAALAESK